MVGTHEQRILVLAPTGRDAALACEVLNKAGLAAEPCRDILALCEALEVGAGAVLLAEEALSPQGQGHLSECLQRQPSWSDLPVVIFAATIESVAATTRMQQMLEVLGNVTFVERPMRVPTLVTAMRAALRARGRQYMARQTQLALEQQEESARHRADFEQQLIGIVSHDLRNPLNAIHLTATTLMRREDLDARTTKAAVRIQSSTERATRMVRDLLDFTQARLGGSIPVKPQPLNLHELTRQVVDEVQMNYPERELQARHEGDAQGHWDSDRMAQVLTNLLSNAMKYSPEGTPVTVVTRGVGDWVTLEVRNTGDPITEETRLRLFEPMQRGATEVGRTERSVGLGLYIVRNVVEAHQGTIDVRSTQEEGTLFTVRLPRQPPKP
ncbi:HAMP domain-containing sensor histidine kinase [Hyalangium rubrum]|uniref:histidine kinase n=1 Tax=Hyalangium rubrum TaxID=3103134 RepID=A0ABU5H2F2_9BACT|nr:HAMP domain-containing sensor histidine kinase [Hyalangium sp. s54d21]MDY7227633.1 HAMP domain-containing sensor histidine kinase [Hyalangium sp. s54d21]